jgi:hypothetical protein
MSIPPQAVDDHSLQAVVSIPFKRWWLFRLSDGNYSLKQR